jgi:hypothetical protein
MPDLDTQLLNRESLSEKEQKRAGRLINKDKRIKEREKNKGQEKSEDNEKEEQDENKEKKAGKLKKGYQQLMDTGWKGVKEKAKQETKAYAKKKAATPIRMGTNRLLRWSWITLIPSWGLSLIYINIHAFMHMILPSLFCELGDEWVPAQIKKAGAEGSRVARIIEKMVLMLADWIALFIVFVAFALMTMLVYAATEPLDALLKMGGALLKSLGEMLQ